MKNWDPKLLEQLLQVQEIDLKIRGISKEIDEVYRKSKEEDPQIVSGKTELKKIEESIETAEAQRHMYIDTLEDIRTAIKGLAATKSGSPKPRTRSSTEALRVEEDKLSLMVVEIENQMKALNSERKRLSDYLQERSRNVETLQQGPEAEIRKLRVKIRRFEIQRSDAVKGVPLLLLRKYERLQRSRSGVGLTVLRDGVCTVCRMQMPTATNSRLTYGEHIPVCPACGRIVARVDFVEMQRVSVPSSPLLHKREERAAAAPEMKSGRKLKKAKAAKKKPEKKPAKKLAKKPEKKPAKKLAKKPAKKLAKKPATKPTVKKKPAVKTSAKKAPAKKSPADRPTSKKAKTRPKSAKK